jgi:hypothetical protein
MDSFSVAVVIGGGIVLGILVLLVVLDKGAPEGAARGKPRRK